MIVEPVPTGPRSSWRRGRWIAGLVLPVLLLGAVVGFATLGVAPGTGPSPAVPAAAEAPAAELPEAQPTRAAPPSGPPDDAGGGDADDEPVALVKLPAAFDGWSARRPSEVVADRRAGELASVVVVAGWLAIRANRDPCQVDELDRPVDAAGPWCARDVVIADTPWDTTGVDPRGSMPPHLHATIPVGVGVTAIVAATTREIEAGPVPVVVFGRFAEGSTCATERCDRGFIIDRVAWADGGRIGVVTVFDPRLDEDTPLMNPFTVALEDGEVPLMAVLALPGAVALVDPAAAPAATASGRPDPVWYVRVVDQLGTDDSRAPIVRWRLLDARRLEVVADGLPDHVDDTATGLPTS